MKKDHLQCQKPGRGLNNTDLQSDIPFFSQTYSVSFPCILYFYRNFLYFKGF